MPWQHFKCRTMSYSLCQGFLTVVPVWQGWLFYQFVNWQWDTRLYYSIVAYRPTTVYENTSRKKKFQQLIFFYILSLTYAINNEVVLIDNGKSLLSVVDSELQPVFNAIDLFSKCFACVLLPLLGGFRYYSSPEGFVYAINNLH